MAVSTGASQNRGVWTKTYSDGSKLYYSTFVQYNTGQGERGLDPSSIKTYVLYNRPRGLVSEWVTGGELGVDGKIRPLKNSEAFRVTGESFDQLEKLGSGGLYDYPQNDYVLGDLARRDLSTGGTNSLRYETINNAKFLLQKDSGVSSEEVNRAYDISHNIAPPGQPGTPGLFGPAVPADASTESPPTPPESSLSPNEISEINEENASTKEGTRSEKDYEDVIYPENLKSEYQDCIKFTIVKYQQSGLAGFEESDAGARFVDVSEGKPGFSKGKNRTTIATIVLPIPGGIQDSNTVNWSGGSLNPLEEAIGSVVQTALQGGDAGAEVQSQAQSALQEESALRRGIISKVTQGILGNNNIMQRQYGSIINPNLELLFNTPELRTFSFSFKLSPRSSSEAQNVKKVIRNFKQAMSVKRSSSSFLLQSPHTFAISYIFKNQAHPYLNRFKECALISCNVNYTPEGNYMAFDDSDHPSMVSYQLDLVFQELEPLYDDEYGNDYNNIGF